MSDPSGNQPAPAFSGVFSGTFLSVAALVLLGFQGARLLSRGSDAPARPVAQRGDLAPEERSIVALFEAASPAVVSITSSNMRQSLREGQLEVPEGSGSGFVWDEQGHVVTNYHVVSVGSLWDVRFKDGTSYPAEFVGAAPDYDLAVLALELEDAQLQPLPLGRSSDLRVGQRSFAIGYPFGLEQTLTTGVVSGLDREIQSQGSFFIHGVIQTDAAINPGNSGGPLLDSAGRLIGINTAIASGVGVNTGVGFAVPVDSVNRIVPRILSEGSFDRAALGVVPATDVYAADAGLEGAVIGGLTPGGPADRAGLIPARESREGPVILGDVIVGIDDFPIRRKADLYQALETYREGDEVRVRVNRPGADGRRVEEVRVRLAAVR